MNFYQIEEPYSATMVAHDEIECLKIYTDVVSDIEDEDKFYAELKTINRNLALVTLADAEDVECGGKVGLMPAITIIDKYIKNDEANILVMEMP